MGHSDCAPHIVNKHNISIRGIRLLEIRKDVLVLVKNVKDLQSYSHACLSHCWGSGKPISKILVGTLREYLTVGIEIGSLPLSFRDAVEVYKRLGITYIWIDSLCIIQNNVDDWRIQATLMVDLYENARITVAAAASHNPTQGCFRKTHWAYVGQPLPRYTDRYIRRVNHGPSAIYAVKARDWPLFTRGKVFQELNLSPRIIHFGNQKLMWQCQSKQYHEDQQNTTWNFTPRIKISRKFSKLEPSALQQEWYVSRV
jgi:hypothetical protein